MPTFLAAFLSWENSKMAAGLRLVPVVLLVLKVWSPATCRAQQVAAGSISSVPLTLRDALQLGLKQNPQRVIAHILVPESDRNS
jgi:hypothetical protein